MLGLEKEVLAGVALDVLEEEKEISDEVELMLSPQKQAIDFKTMCIDHVLMHHPKVLVTPHNAFNTHEALQRILETTVENIKSFADNKQINTV